MMVVRFTQSVSCQLRLTFTAEKISEISYCALSKHNKSHNFVLDFTFCSVHIDAGNTF